MLTIGSYAWLLATVVAVLQDPVGENPPIATVIVYATSLMTVALMQVH